MGKKKRMKKRNTAAKHPNAQETSAASIPAMPADSVNSSKPASTDLPEEAILKEFAENVAKEAHPLTYTETKTTQIPSETASTLTKDPEALQQPQDTKEADSPIERIADPCIPKKPEYNEPAAVSVPAADVSDLESVKEGNGVSSETEAARGVAATAAVTATATATLEAESGPDACEEIFSTKLSLHYDELKWLYCELYQDIPDVMEAFSHLIENIKLLAQSRPKCLRELDGTAANVKTFTDGTPLGMQLDSRAFAGSLTQLAEKIPYLTECKTSYLHLYPLTSESSNGNQEGASVLLPTHIDIAEELLDLSLRLHKAGIRLSTSLSMPLAASGEDFQKPEGFFHFTDCLLKLASCGVDIIVLKDLENVWNYEGTYCRNFMPIHSILRMTRMITEMVCPSLLLSAEVNLTADGAAYLGTEEKPECHMLRSQDLAPAIWHTLATKDAALLKKEADSFASLPPSTCIQASLRSYEAMRWQLDYLFLRDRQMEEAPHKEYLNSYLTGTYPESLSRGETYPEDAYLGDAGLCGTTASFCGIEKAGYEGDMAAMEDAVNLDIMLHALLLSLSHAPMLYSGDEIGQVNDYSYHENMDLSFDSRNLHRGKFSWHLAERRKEKDTVQYHLFQSLHKLQALRGSHPAFTQNGKLRTIDTWDRSILALCRETASEKWIGLYNFSPEDHVAWINEEDGPYLNMLSGESTEAKALQIPAGSFMWLMQER